MPEVVFVGTGDAFGSGGRRQSAILVREAGRTLLLDCGPTTLSGLRTLGIDPGDIDAIAISHFHGDHAAGLPFLLLDRQFQSRGPAPLEVLGPPGIEARMDNLTRAYGFAEALTDRTFDLRYSEFEIDRDCVTQGFTLRPFPAHHQPSTYPHMLHVGAGARSLFFTGDTGWHPEFPDRVGEVDLAIAECVLMQPGFEWHLNHDRLVAERKRFRAGRIVLTHLGAEVLSDLDRVEFDTAHDGLALEF